MREIIKRCRWCGGLFIASNPLVKYCSKECRDEKNRKASRERAKEKTRYQIERNKRKKEKRKDFEERVKLAKMTGVHYGIITAYWHDKEKLKKIIAYEQKIGRAKPKPMDQEENKPAAGAACYRN